MRDPKLGDLVVTDNLDVGTAVEVDYRNSYVTVEFDNNSKVTRRKFRFSEVGVIGVDPAFPKKAYRENCECGASHTSNKEFHLSYCPLAKK